MGRRGPLERNSPLFKNLLGSRAAWTLFLGINDDNAAGNGGGHNVLITFTPA
jgi:hypothetical protein